MILHSEAGIGIDAVNLQSRKKMASAYKKYLSSRLNLETLAEEQRILYVAMTRAKEKLSHDRCRRLKEDRGKAG